MIAGIILAAGKGTRIKSKDRNKVTLPFLNKPLVTYGVELMSQVADKVVVVVGSFHESVKDVLKNYKVTFANQKKRLGTAHATKVGLKFLIKLRPPPSLVLVGYGDHTMFYKKQNVQDLIALHRNKKAVMSLITVKYDNASLHWGFIIRDDKNKIVDSIEFKDASKIQKQIKELNAGFYCFDFMFLNDNITKVPKSLISGEYYINSLIKIAAGQGKYVAGLEIPFSQVGIGINRYSELEESQKLYLKISRPSTILEVKAEKNK